jgi:hypothetical protein
MFECVTQAEEEEQQRAFGECSKGGTGSRDQHKRIDFELAEFQIVDGLAQRKKPPKK